MSICRQQENKDLHVFTNLYVNHIIGFNQFNKEDFRSQPDRIMHRVFMSFKERSRLIGIHDSCALDRGLIIENVEEEKLKAIN